MKPHVETTTHLELRVLSGCMIKCQGVPIQLEGHKDAACLVLITMCGRTIMNEQIVAVTTDTEAFLRLIAFAKSDGGITLHRDLG